MAEVRIEADALIERLNKVITEALDERDKKALRNPTLRKDGLPVSGDQSPLAIEFRACISTVKKYFAQRAQAAN